MKLSVSKIEEFDKCKYSYYLTNISQEKKESEDPAQLIKGVEIHQMFDDAYKDIIDNKDRQEVLKAIETQIKKDPKYVKYKDHADNFLALNKRIGGSLPLYREVKLFDSELNISGVIDRVDYDGNSLVIIDYKTGKESTVKKHHFQLAIYTYLFSKTHNQNPTHWGIYFSDTGNLLIEKVNWDLVRKACSKVSSTRKEILKTIESNQWDKKPSFLCKWCKHYKGNNGKCDGGSKTW
jgi:RecB family exonuclease